MRRSCAPSVRKAEKRKSDELKATSAAAIKCLENSSPTADRKRLKGNKIAFNIQWRKSSKMKHKTWKGNGIVEVLLDKNRAVLLDHTGKYMGASDKFKTSDLVEGFQMRIGDKEIEFLEQIVNQNEYWAIRKTLVENRGWGNEEWHPPDNENEEKKLQPSPLIVTRTIDLNSQMNTKKPKSNNMQPIVTDMSEQSGTSNLRYSIPVAESLIKKLRPHQLEGVEFLYRSLVEYKEQCEYNGCILADEMGLGKTLQVLTVANALLRQNYAHRVLIVSPRSLIGNWNNEIYKWLHAERMYGFTVDGSGTTSNKKLSAYSKQQHVPFVIVSYETLVSQLQDFRSLNFDLIICDEGHRLKNADTKTYKALRELNIKRCILLTGTPVQNVLSEFYVLADFVNPGIFGSRAEFRQQFEIPMELGQSSTATEEHKLMALGRAEELKQISSKFMVRRLQGLNSNYLPTKREYICLVRPSKLQHLLLREALKFYDTKKELAFQDISPLEIISILRKICNHPYLLKRTKSENILTRFLARHMIDIQQMNAIDSTKLLLVQNFLLKAVLSHREKVVLVSYHTKTLDVLQQLCDVYNLKCLRLDGSTPTAERNVIVSKFNENRNEVEDEAFVLLLSAKAGGTGLNLIGASRLVLYDVDWNPANDAQALSRIWRDGQQKDVHIYRLITAGCIEEKIFQRQMAKTSISDFLAPKDATSNAISMKFSTEELQELFYLQYDYNICDTHQSLKCSCIGDGQNLFDIDEPSNGTKQINELGSWRHWKPNFEQHFMKTACLWEAKEDMIYLFTNETTNNRSL